jgi:hypothetical protein
VHALGLWGTLVSVRMAGSRETAPRKAMTTSATEDTPVAPAVQAERRRDPTRWLRERGAAVAMRPRVAHGRGAGRKQREGRSLAPAVAPSGT